MSSTSQKRAASSSSLLVIVLDCSPLAWGERNVQRTAVDKARAAQGKRSVGPAVLEEVVQALQAFGAAVLALESAAALLVVAVADCQSAVVYPRKDLLEAWLHPQQQQETSDGPFPTADTQNMQRDMMEGIAELIARTCTPAQSVEQAKDKDGAPTPTPIHTLPCMASAFSKALCLINRFLLANSHGGYLGHHSTMTRSDNDQGVVALLSSNGGGKSDAQQTAGAWSPRVLLVQASEDRSRDYNAFMNCAFSAVKHNVVIDGCYLSAGGKNSKSSAFLEQACDLSQGTFLAPSGAAQVGGALTEVLLSVFLPPLSCRSLLHLPALTKVDFRARCFQTGQAVDMAFVCNQCLSIFSTKPNGGYCPTCQAPIRGESHKRRRREDRNKVS